MEEYKSLLGSKTVWGVIVMALGLIFGRLGFNLDAETQAQLVNDFVGLVPTITQVVGAFLAIYGRIVATKKIG